MSISSSAGPIYGLRSDVSLNSGGSGSAYGAYLTATAGNDNASAYCLYVSAANYSNNGKAYGIYVQDNYGGINQWAGYFGGKVAVTGNFGVGADTPENTENWTKVAEVRGTTNSKFIVTTNSVTSGLWSHNTGTYGSLAGGITGTASNHPFSIVTNKINRITISASGNVGIGTTSPSQKLDIKGGGIRVCGSGDTGSPIVIQNESKTQAGQASAWNIWNMTGNYGNSLQFWAYDQTACPNGLCASRLTLMDNGNVGIGTTSPENKLDVNGTTQTEKLLINKPNNTDNWNNIWQSGFYESYNINSAPESSYWFWGISMNHTSNRSTYRYGGQIVIRNSSTTPTMYFRSVDVNGSGTWAKILHSVGNQEINGTLRAKEIKIDINAGADFVFAPDYNLKPLSDVESFINANKHLPEIPSEKAMQEDGLSINEFQIKLLQKIEELTLYAIEQNKTIEELKKEVKELKETK